MDSTIFLIGAFIVLIMVLVAQLNKANREVDFRRQYEKFSQFVAAIEEWINDHPHLSLPHPTVQEEVNRAYAYAWWLKLHFPEMVEDDRKVNRVLRNYAEHVGPLQKAHD